jgi:hypothetical protein
MVDWIGSTVFLSLCFDFILFCDFLHFLFRPFVSTFCPIVTLRAASGVMQASLAAEYILGTRYQQARCTATRVCIHSFYINLDKLFLSYVFGKPIYFLFSCIASSDA